MECNIEYLIRKYYSDIELTGNGNVDLGHNLAEAINSFYGPKFSSVRGNFEEENKLRIKIKKMDKNSKLYQSQADSSVKDSYLNEIISRLDKKIAENNN